MFLSIKQYFGEENKPVNRIFVGIVIALVSLGALALFSASFGLLSRDGPSLQSIISKQILFSLIPGILLAWLISRTHYTLWRKLALFLFIATIFLNIMIFTSLGAEHGGATRWLKIGGMTIQPSEFLKIAFIIYLASWLSGIKEKIKDFRFGLLPFFIITAVTVSLLIFERDTDNAVIITFTALAMYFSAGARWKDLAIVAFIGIIGLSTLFYARPYLRDRLMSFIDPSVDTEDTSYQINQSIIAIGSGEFIGRGFGQSVQKFSRLPEPIGDSIFAVIGEEFGFVGSVIIILLFSMFIMQGLRISIRSPDSFGRLLALGIVILIGAQSFLNITSMLGLVPVAGLTLVFVSNGGSSLLASLVAVGVVLNVSRYSK